MTSQPVYTQTLRDQVESLLERVAERQKALEEQLSDTSEAPPASVSREAYERHWDDRERTLVEAQRNRNLAAALESFLGR